jgi:hypothetical protein
MKRKARIALVAAVVVSAMSAALCFGAPKNPAGGRKAA